MRLDLTRDAVFSARFLIDRSVLRSSGVYTIGLHADVYHVRHETNLARINLRLRDEQDFDSDGDLFEAAPPVVFPGSRGRRGTFRSVP